MELVGRGFEQATLHDLLVATREGTSGAVVVRGEPGSGKTALLEDLAAQAVLCGFLVVRVTGVEFESPLAHAGLVGLVDALAGHVDGLPAPQREALRAAVGLVDGPAAPLAVRAGFLAALAEAAEQQPVLLVVDDAQWTDRATLEVLLFAVRRLHADRVLVAFGTRLDDRGPLSTTPLPRIDLGPIAEQAASALLGPEPIADAVALACWRLTGGNPLALRELAPVLSREQRLGILPLDDPLPLGLRLGGILRARLDALPASTRRALLVCAAEERGDLATVAPALVAAGLSVAELEPAEDEGLVTLDDGRVRWQHPLIRSAAYRTAPPADRRAAHLAVAGVLDADLDADRRAWHEAAAAVGPDDDVADRLQSVGARALARGAPEAAARAFLRAAQLSITPAARARRLHAAGEGLWAAGSAHGAVGLLRPALDQTRDPELLARINLVLGQAETWCTGPREAVRILAEAAATAPTPALASGLLTHATSASLLAGDLRRALDLAEEAVRCGEAADDPVTLFPARALLGHTLLLRNQPTRAAELLDEIRPLVEALLNAGIPEVEILAQVIAHGLIVSERHAEAEAMLRTIDERSRARGFVGAASIAHAFYTELQWRTGQWAEAQLRMINLRDAVTQSGNEPPIMLASAFLARVEAGMGRDSAREAGAVALEMAVRTGMGAVLIWASSALGLLELGLGRHHEAVARFEPVAKASAAWEAEHPGIAHWQADYIEALLGAGERGRALDELAVLTDRATASGSVWAAAAARRCCGWTASSPDAADDLFSESIELFAGLAAPFEQARSLLARAEVRANGARPDLAGADARAALAGFERLGAAPWAARARACIGSGPRAPEPLALAAVLTEGELRVAMSIGRGASNKEAAQHLYLSQKTVDYHLQNIYKKLGIRSRSQLAIAVARELDRV